MRWQQAGVTGRIQQLSLITAIGAALLGLPAVASAEASPVARAAGKIKPKASRLSLSERGEQGAAANKLNVLQRGKASWYGPGFHGRKTANGERFNMNELTAAHKTLPFGTRVVVRNPSNGKQVTVRINDRGPYAHGRIIDLSKAAAHEIGLLGRGHGSVELHSLGRAKAAPSTATARSRVKQPDAAPVVEARDDHDREKAEPLAVTSG